MKYFYLLLLFTLTNTIAIADIKKEIAKCSEDKDSVTRLECFDKIAKSEGLARKIENIPTNNNWIVSEDKSKIDDSKKVTMFVTSNESIEGKYRREKITPKLILRCLEDKTEVFVTVDMFLGSDSIKVTSRLDKNKSTKRNWGISTDHVAMFYPRGDIGFIRKLMKHKILLLEFTPYSESPRLVEFDVSGLSDVIKPLQEACHWK